MLRARSSALTARTTGLAVCILLTAAAAPLRAQEAVDPPGRVARIDVALGAVSLQPAGSDTWISDVLNRPLTTGDKLWADRESRVELHVGSAAVRLGSETGMGLLNVDDRTVQLKLTTGTLSMRVPALGPNQIFEVATPSAAVSLLEPGDYRVDVSESGDALTAAALSGQVAITAGNEAVTLGAGQEMQYTGGDLADTGVTSLSPADAFDQWVADRDGREDRAVATRYLSPDMTGYGDLDDYGTWQVVDNYGAVWIPAVGAGWAPYRDGHWAWISPWGWTWIDAAPWGFAPFHYGRWLNLGGTWGWVPGPRQYAPVYAPALVGWVGGAGWSTGLSAAVADAPVAWFPLGWNEVYVPPYPVSNTYSRNVNATNIRVSNEYLNTVLAGNATVSGAGPDRTAAAGRGLTPLGGIPYRNLAIPGAVTATTRSAFTSAAPVQQHRAEAPPDPIARASATTRPPAIAPNALSVGRRAEFAPRVAPELWNRPVIARTVPPPAPVPFEQQRRAVIANGGLPVPTRAYRSAATDRPPALGSAPSPRADVIRTEPVALPRPGSQDRGAPVQRIVPADRPVRPPGAAAQPPPATDTRPAIPESRPDAEPSPPVPPDARPAPRPAPPPARSEAHPPEHDTPHNP